MSFSCAIALVLSLVSQCFGLSEQEISQRRAREEIRIDGPNIPNKPPDNYILTSARLQEIRNDLMYPYFDADVNSPEEGEIKKDYQEDINVGSVLLNKQLNFRFSFYGMAYNYTWISLNGYIGFSNNPQVVVSYPLTFPHPKWPQANDPSFIGPFYSEILIGELDGREHDRRRPGLYFRVERDLGARKDKMGVEIRERLKWDIKEGIVGSRSFLPQHCAIVTWKNVSFNGGKRPESLKVTNTFQLIIATDEVMSYAIFNYEHLGWTTHTGAGGDHIEGQGGTPAFVGFNAGNGSRAFEYVPFSQSMQIRDLPFSGNVNGKAGRHMFRIDEKILPGACNPEPYETSYELVFAPEQGPMLGGTRVNFTGPCLLPGQKIICRFDSWPANGYIIDENRGSCITPMMTTSGYVDFAISVDGGPYHWRGKFFVETPMTAPKGIIFDESELLKIKPDVFHIEWDKGNLTLDDNAAVEISLWGYQETSIDPEFVFIGMIVEGIKNTGQYDIVPADYDYLEKRKFTDLTVGLMKINLTNPQQHVGLRESPALWSRPFALSWYLHSEWQEQHGHNWAAKLCYIWMERDFRMKQFAYEIPRCPCLLDQARSAKSFFAPDFSCDEDGNTECLYHKGAEHCIRTALPNKDGAGQQCCYDREGYLMMTSDKQWGGNPHRAHNLGMLPYYEANKVPSLSHWYLDISGFFKCCLWQNEQSDGCERFRFELRPSQDCVGYEPPAVAGVFGDPHIHTFDDVQYTFNGKGEFVLVRANNKHQKLDIQGRFEGVPQNKLGWSRGTMLTSVAAKDNQSSIVEVRLRAPEAQWRYKLDVLVDSRPVYFDLFSTKIQQFKGVTVYTPSHILNQSQVVVMFQSGAGLEVVESSGYMSCRVYLPTTFVNQTRGLFGNWSFNKEDDFLTPTDDPEGYMYIDTNNLKKLHDDFGMKWAVEDKEVEAKGKTLFTHANGRSSNFYYDKLFQPTFDKFPALPNNITLDSTEVKKFCGESEQCYFDYAVTFNRDFAKWTKHYQDEFVNIKKIGLQRVLSCGSLRTPKHGRKSTFAFTPGTEVKFDCDPGYILVGDKRRVCEVDQKWSIPEEGEARCLTKTRFFSMKAGITSGSVLAILIPLILVTVCLVCLVRYKKRKNTDSERAKSTWQPRSQQLNALSNPGENASSSSGNESRNGNDRIKPKPNPPSGKMDAEYYTGEPLSNRPNYQFPDVDMPETLPYNPHYPGISNSVNV